MRQMMTKWRWSLKIMSGPGDTRGRGVLGHDRGSLHSPHSDTGGTTHTGTPVTATTEIGSTDTGTADYGTTGIIDNGTIGNRTFDTGTTDTGVRA